MASVFASEAEALSLAPEGKTPGPMVLGEGELHPEVMLVKRSPSLADRGGGKPLLGQDGLPIRKAMLRADVSYYATNAFPFVTQGGKVSVAEARRYSAILSEEIERVQPQNVVLLGADAARWTTAFPIPFKRHNEVLGRIFDADGRKWAVTKAAGAISSVPSEYRGFIDLVAKLVRPEDAEQVATPERERYSWVTYPKLARTILRSLPRRVALDIETDGLDPYTCRILTLQVSGQAGTGYSFPWDLLTPAEWAQALGAREWVFQNGSFDVKVLAANGVFLKIAEDTMLMHSLVDETPGTHSMEQMAHRYLGVEKWTELVDYERMDEAHVDDLAKYGARDADLTLRLATVFRPVVQGRYINEVLHGLQNALIHAELRGVRVNRELADQFDREIESALHDHQQRMEDVYGLRNPNSPKQVLDLLLELGVPLGKTKGKYSTAEDAISQYSDMFPVVHDILEYRHLTKARGTYISNILAGSERDGRYHPDFSVARTETGRLAEKLITLIPRADATDNPDLGKRYQARMRELFIPDEGMVLVGADYSGLELGMAAYLSRDPAMVDDIAQGRDTHSILAIQAFNLPVELEPMATLKARTVEHYAHQRTLAKSLCVPMDSQALTREGWRSYHELSVGDEVLTYNQETNSNEWQPILSKVLYGDSPVVKMSHGHKWEVRCTPDHRWYGEVRRTKGGVRAYEPAVFTSETMTTEHRFTVAAPSEGGDSLITPQEASIIAWVITDGHHHWAECGSGGSQGNDAQRRRVFARILQKKERQSMDIDLLLKDVPHSSGVRKDNGMRYWDISSPWFRGLWDRAGLDRDDPDYEKFVLSLSIEARRAFLSACWDAEGHTAARGVKMFSQNEGREQRAMHLAAFLEGYDVRVGWSRDPRGTANHAKMRLRARPYVNATRVVTTKLPDEPVWCIQTPNRTWVMKQGDTMTITGNTFGFLFGSSGQSMTKYMSLEDAEQLIEALGRRWPGLIEWQAQVRSQARRGHVETPWGRRRHFYYDSALGGRVHAQQDRECINFPIQAQATDMNSLAFTRLTELGYQMLFPLHDAVYLQVQEDKVDQAVKDVRDVMENVLPGVVPFRCDIHIGATWAEL